MEATTEYLGVTQVANALGVSASAIYKWVDKGILKPDRLPGGRRRFRREDVEALRESMRAPK